MDTRQASKQLVWTLVVWALLLAAGKDLRAQHDEPRKEPLWCRRSAAETW
jgi:hypothetical protein